MSGDRSTTPSIVREPKTTRKASRPRRFRVLLHNDHYTTMDFVVDVLRTVFRKPAIEAVRIMLSVHHEGVGVCGIYTAEVAESKVKAVHSRAEDAGYPLKCSMEPE